jgi:hypothetical protein
MGTAQQGVFKSRFKNGAKDYSIGNHPLWELFRSAYQTTKKPFLIGGLAVLSGYAWSALTRAPRPVSRELVKFYRAEQMHRLRQIARKRLPSRKTVLDHPAPCA